MEAHSGTKMEAQSIPKIEAHVGTQMEAHNVWPGYTAEKKTLGGPLYTLPSPSIPLQLKAALHPEILYTSCRV